MIVSMPMFILASQLAMPVADRAPTFNVDPSCQAAATSGVALNRDKQRCLDEEHGARDQLDKQWSQYLAGDRTRCTQSTAMGGVPSYVELQTCLDMAKAARELPDDDFNHGTVGRGSAR